MTRAWVSGASVRSVAIARPGWRFRGRATVYTGGAAFDEVIAHFAALGRASAALAKAVVIVDVQAADLLLSPAYDDGSTQQQIAARWLPRWQARLERLHTALESSSDSSSSGPG